ncbi:hypothetical protein D1641_07190 [Colidextribacter sp. OB.20]|nr:hypothetical protein [Colidextribacter sp. OB.20]
MQILPVLTDYERAGPQFVCQLRCERIFDSQTFLQRLDRPRPGVQSLDKQQQRGQALLSVHHLPGLIGQVRSRIDYNIPQKIFVLLGFFSLIKVNNVIPQLFTGIVIPGVWPLKIWDDIPLGKNLSDSFWICSNCFHLVSSLQASR